MTKEQFDLEKEATDIEHFCRGLMIKENRIAELKVFVQRCMDFAYERAANLVETHDEVSNSVRGKRYLEKKTSTNVNGNTYAEGIRSLQSPAAKKESK